MTACPKCGYDAHAVIDSTWQFHIALPVQSGNRHIYNVGSSRWRYAKERNDWQTAIKAERISQRIPTATGKRRVTFTRYYGGRQREMDPDNMATGLKSCLDALVREGMLVDDKREFAEVSYVQIQTSVEEQRGLLITLEDFANAG